MSDQISVLKGGCFCGAASFSVTASGAPLLSAYCHCTNCQRLTACPFIHTMHFDGPTFAWTHAAPHEAKLDYYTNPGKPWKKRWRCKECGSSVSSYNSNTDRWSVWGCQLERNEDGKIKDWDKVKPTAHMFYGTRLLDVDDELGKWEGYEDKSEKLA